MSKNLTRLSCYTLFILLGFFLIPNNARAQLSGKYTINPTIAASSSNYKDWASAIGDLTSGSRSDSGPAQGPGVSSAVVIEAFDTTYKNQQLSISSIKGTSSSNTVTFTSASGDSSLCVLQNVSKTGSSGDFVVQLNGCTYVTFTGLGFERTGTNSYSTVIDITNGSDNCTITHCWLKGRKVPSNSSLGFVYGIGSVIYFTGNGDAVEISHNKLIYGYNGIYTTTSNAGVYIHHNVIDTSGSSGIYMSGQSGLKIEANTFNMGDFGPSTGHYVSYGMRIEGSPAMQITKNKLYMMAKNGQVVRAIMLATTSSTSNAHTIVANNWIVNSGGTGDCTGLALYACDWVDLYYNNVLITNSLKSGACYYHYATYANTNIRLVDNVLVNSGGGFVYNFPGSNVSDMASIDYNNCYHTGTYFGKYNGSDYSTFSSWQTNARRDTNSVYADPGFTSGTDLHVSNISLNGMAIPFGSINDDIDGETRSSTSPDIGADEFFPANLDAGVSKLDSPAAFCAGSNYVKVTFQNFGIDTIKSITLNWSVNDTLQKSYSWTGKVAPGASSASLNLGTFKFVKNRPYSFKIWTSGPNGSSDGKNVNDTLKLTRLTGMSGTYTIGNTSKADYKSFNDAINEMTARGLCGATTFNVYDGIYKEQITLVQLDGMGPSAPLKFQSISKDSSKVVVVHPSTTATGNNNAALQLRGADNVTFKGITFKRTGTNTYAQVIHILNGAHNNTFTNCAMHATHVTTTNADGVNIWSNGDVDTNNAFINNYIKHGTYNIQYTGFSSAHETGTVIKGNFFDSAYYGAVLINYNDGLVFSNNSFGNVRNTINDNFCLKLNDCDNGIVVMNNYFNDRNTDIAIALDGCDAKSTNPGLIANNMLARTNGRGFYLSACNNQTIAFNNMYFRGTNAGNIALATSSASGSGLNLLNNNFRLDSGIVYNIYIKGHVARSDYNNYYTLSSRFGKFNGKWYKSMAAFNKTTKNDSNSLEVDPYFVSNTDLHTRNTALNGAGTPLWSVALDFDGELRNISHPDIGADEFDAQPNDAGVVTFSSPESGACEGKNDIKLVIKNFGKNDLKSLTIDWEINAASQKTVSWTGNLKPLETDTVKLGSSVFSSGKTVTLSARSSKPNGQSDDFTPNDAVSEKKSFNALPFINPGSDKDVCAGDSVRIGLAGSANFVYTWFDLSGNKVGSDSRVYVKPTVTTRYYQQMTSKATGCTNRDTIEVRVNPLPQINAGTDGKYCVGQQLSLGQKAVTGNSYQWQSIPAGFSSTAANPVVSLSGNIVYILTQTVDASGCSLSDSVSLMVNPSPDANASGGTVFCAGATAKYSTAGATGDTYSWTVKGGNLLSGDGTTEIKAEWPTAVSGSIVLIETNSYGCNDTSIVYVNVSKNPTAKFDHSGMCTGSDVQFKDKSSDNDDRFWDFGNGSNATNANPAVAYTKAGTYTVQLIATTKEGCSDTTTEDIDIYDTPVADFSVKTKVCEKEDIQLMDKSTHAADYVWDFGSGRISTETQPTQAYNASGNYAIKLVVNNGGCKDSLTQKVTVNKSPDATFTLNLDLATVSVSPVDISLSDYLWDFGDGNTSTKKNEEHKYDIKKGWVYVKLTVTNDNGCKDTKTDSVYIDVSGIGDLPYGLSQISLYPNPTNAYSTLAFSLRQSGRVVVQLYDLQGRLIHNVLNAELPVGSSKVLIDKTELNLQTGTYLVRMSIDGNASAYRMLEIR